MITSGLISEKAFRMIFGLGTLVRKCTCMPTVISYRNSNIRPYMWARGSIETTLLPLPICGRALFLTKSMLDQIAR